MRHRHRDARQHELTIYQEHGIGEFVVQGNPLVSIVGMHPLSDEIREACIECFDLGETRTMQQDFQFGIRQIVDMALKAISPAINDPSTANTCLDHLARILCHLTRRRILPLELRDPESGRLLMVRHASTFRGSMDLAFNQLRQYGRGDMAGRRADRDDSPAGDRLCRAGLVEDRRLDGGRPAIHAHQQQGQPSHGTALLSFVRRQPIRLTCYIRLLLSLCSM